MRSSIVNHHARRVAIVALLSSVLGCGTDAPDHASRFECQRLSEHILTIRMQTVTADHEQHRDAIRASLQPFVPTCTSSMTPEQVRCAVAAVDAKSLAACSAGGAS